MKCAKCDRDWPEDRYNLACTTPDWCFACRSKTVGTTFQGGRDYFREDMERRRAERAIAEAKAAGFDPVPVETKGWNAGSATALRKIGDVGTKSSADSVSNSKV